MPIPDFQSVLPSLIAIFKVGVANNREVVRQVSDDFKVSDPERQRIIDNRVHWAITYMTKTGLIFGPSRGNSSITDEGKIIFASTPEHINVRFQKQYDQFKEFHQAKAPPTERRKKPSPVVDQGTNPLEQVKTTYQELKKTTCQVLLEKAQCIDPSDFERIVVRLIKEMRYGGSGEVTHLGQSIFWPGTHDPKVPLDLPSD